MSANSRMSGEWASLISATEQQRSILPPRGRLGTGGKRRLISASRRNRAGDQRAGTHLNVAPSASCEDENGQRQLSPDVGYFKSPHVPSLGPG